MYVSIPSLSDLLMYVQYILASPNSPVPLRKVFVPISEFVRIGEIASFLTK